MIPNFGGYPTTPVVYTFQDLTPPSILVQPTPQVVHTFNNASVHPRLKTICMQAYLDIPGLHMDFNPLTISFCELARNNGMVKLYSASPYVPHSEFTLSWSGPGISEKLLYHKANALGTLHPRVLTTGKLGIIMLVCH